MHRLLCTARTVYTGRLHQHHGSGGDSAPPYRFRRFEVCLLREDPSLQEAPQRKEPLPRHRHHAHTS